MAGSRLFKFGIEKLRNLDKKKDFTSSQILAHSNNLDQLFNEPRSMILNNRYLEMLNTIHGKFKTLLKIFMANFHFLKCPKFLAKIPVLE